MTAPRASRWTRPSGSADPRRTVHPEVGGPVRQESSVREMVSRRAGSSSAAPAAVALRREQRCNAGCGHTPVARPKEAPCMQLNVTFRQMDSSDFLKDYAREKVERVNKYLDRAGEANVVFSLEIGRATSELQSRENLVCRLLLEKKNIKSNRREL